MDATANGKETRKAFNGAAESFLCGNHVLCPDEMIPTALPSPVTL